MQDRKTKPDGFHIRRAERKDAALILKYIRELAEFENELDQVYATVSRLEENMFDKHGAEALIGEYEGKSIGFAFFHTSFSTFLAKPSIHLVDLYIEPEMRGRGFGRAMLAELAKITKEWGADRLEWWVHDWNTEAIGHYEKWAARQVDFIRVYRMTGEALTDFADSAPNFLQSDTDSGSSELFEVLRQFENHG